MIFLDVHGLRGPAQPPPQQTSAHPHHLLDHGDGACHDHDQESIECAFASALRRHRAQSEQQLGRTGNNGPAPIMVFTMDINCIARHHRVCNTSGAHTTSAPKWTRCRHPAAASPSEFADRSN